MNPIDTSGIITTFIDIPSTNFANEWIGGEDGIPPIFSGTTVQQKQIDVTIELIACDYLDYQLLRDELYGMFGFNKPFFVVDKRQRGKRHKVVLDANFMPIRHNPINGTAVIPFITCEPHFSESIGTTADIDSNGVNADDELWGFGMGLTSDFREDDDPLKYTIHAKEGEYFRIFNAGNVVIHPFQMDLKITIKDVVGSDGRVHLRNQTNYDYIRIYDDDITESDVFVFDGASVTKNGTAFLRNTERTFISLNRRWNRFQIYYCESATIEFDFRFYYL